MIGHKLRATKKHIGAIGVVEAAGLSKCICSLGWFRNVNKLKKLKHFTIVEMYCSFRTSSIIYVVRWYLGSLRIQTEI